MRVIYVLSHRHETRFLGGAALVEVVQQRQKALGAQARSPSPGRQAEGHPSAALRSAKAGLFSKVSAKLPGLVTFGRTLKCSK